MLFKNLSTHLLLKACCRRLYNWLKVAPYRPDQQVEEDDDLMDESQGKGIRVLGVAYAPSRYVYCRMFLFMGCFVFTVLVWVKEMSNVCVIVFFFLVSYL